jgi:hypothetical protein
MSEHYEDRSPEQLQHDLERTRAEMADTLETLRRKLSPGELLDQALDYLKGSGAGQFSRNLGDTVTHNPIPVTLIGVGIAWLMLAGSRDGHPSRPWGTAERAQSRVGEAASSAADKAGQMRQGARERAQEAGAHMRDTAHSLQERIGDTAGHMREQTRSQMTRARETFGYLRDEHPLILGVLGFALGAALGAGLPPTRREDELIGEVRDEYIQKAREAGEEQLEKVKPVATAASEAAKKEADKQDLLARPQ